MKKAAQTTAFCGERTRVETTVAIELAASWKPLRKSKTSATRMIRTISGASVGIAVAQAFLIATLPTTCVKSLQRSQASSKPS